MAKEGRIHRVEVLPQLAYLDKPFHSDRKNFPSIFISNGRKVGMAKEAHIPHYITDAIAASMDEMENACHARNRKGVLGPAMVGPIPYSLIVATEKALGAKKILNSNWPEYGVAVVTDAVFCMENQNGKIAFTAHKPNNEEDINALINMFKNAGTAGDVKLSTMTGVLRFEFGTKTPAMDELFLVQTDLGIMRYPNDLGRLSKRLHGSNGTAGGIDVPFALDNLVHKPEEVMVHVRKYYPEVGHGGGIHNGEIKPIGGKDISIPSSHVDEAHLAGVGFIS